MWIGFGVGAVHGLATVTAMDTVMDKAMDMVTLDTVMEATVTLDTDMVC